MSVQNQNSDKNAEDLTIEYKNQLKQIVLDYNDSISKVRDDLFKFIEGNKQNVINSDNYCSEIISGIDKDIQVLPTELNSSIQSAFEKHEARLQVNANQIAEYETDYKDSVTDSDEKYDITINVKNDELDNKQYIIQKELKNFLKALDVEERTQMKELNASINSINKEINALTNELRDSIEKEKKNFLAKSSVFNDEMRKIRNDFVIKEKELRNESKVETVNHNKQIEEITKQMINKQKEIANSFSQNLLTLSSSYDQLFEKYKDDQLTLLSEQSDNKVRKNILEVNKKYKIKIEKEQTDTKIKNLKILKQDFDNQLTTRISRENINSLISISKFEKESRFEDAVKENKISDLTLLANNNIKILMEKLNDKKNDLAFFGKRFDLLRNFKKTVIEMYSHFYDVDTTLTLDLNQLEKENVKEHQTTMLNQKIEDIRYLNKVSEFEYNKEVISIELKNNIDILELEKKKVLANFDNLLFKTRANLTVEKTRIESILNMFEIKFQKEIKVLKNDISYLNALCVKFKEEISNVSAAHLEDFKNGKETSTEKTTQFCKMIQAEVDFIINYINEYFQDKSQRLTPDVDEMLEEYLSASNDKRDNLINEYKNIKFKSELTQNDIFDLENDILMLESQKKILLSKVKKDFSSIFQAYKQDTKKRLDDEIVSIDLEIENKNRELRYANEKNKTQQKDLANLESLIEKLDEGTNIIKKKDSSKLFELKLENHYYNNYQELIDYIEELATDLSEITSNALEKASDSSIVKLEASSINKVNSFINKIKRFYNKNYEAYKDQLKKIHSNCQSNLVKEEHTNELNIISVNRDKTLAIEEINSKIAQANRNARDLENKANAKIINSKIESDNLKRDLDVKLDEYNKNYTIRMSAIKSNINSINSYYNYAIQLENKKLDKDLFLLQKERVKNKKVFEGNLAKIALDFGIEKVKVESQSKLRFEVIQKENQEKLENFARKNKELSDIIVRSSKECNSKIIESNSQLGDFIKQLDNQKDSEIKKLRADAFRKLKNDKKKYLKTMA